MSLESSVNPEVSMDIMRSAFANFGALTGG